MENSPPGIQTIPAGAGVGAFPVLATVGPKPGVVDGEVVVFAGSGIAAGVASGVALAGVGLAAMVTAGAPALADSMGLCERPDQTAMPIAIKATTMPMLKPLRLGLVAAEFSVSGCFFKDDWLNGLRSILALE